MIQELLGVVEDRKFPNISGGLLGVPNEPAVASSFSPAHSTTSSSSSAAASTTTSSSTSNGAEQQQQLRCPRCDSTNTKFCYYNNYNLTQPRHFCKTCRRYWTQGGALRNVPIGGGCRKTKSTGISLGGAAKSCNSGFTGIKAAKPQASDVAGGVINGKSGFGGANMGFVDHELPSSPILWAAPQNSHLLSLLRAAQISSCVSNTSTTNASSNPNPNPIRGNMANYTNHPARVVKEEGPMAAGSHLVPEASLLINALNARNLGLDPLGQQVPLGLCNSLWRSSPQYLQHPLQHQQQHQQQPLVPGLQQQQQQQNNIGMLQSSDQSPSSAGIQELIQRLRSTNNVHHYTDHQAPQLVQLGNGCPAFSSSSSSSPAISFSTPAAATTATTAAISEPAAPVAGGDQFGCWINTSTATTPFAWADMPNINGAFP